MPTTTFNEEEAKTIEMYEKSDVKNNVKKEYLFPRPRPYGKIPSCTTSQDVQEEIRGHQPRMKTVAKRRAKRRTKTVAKSQAKGAVTN